MARRYKKRVSTENQFQMIDLTNVKEECLCLANNICICKKDIPLKSEMGSSKEATPDFESSDENPLSKPISRRNGFLP